MGYNSDFTPSTKDRIGEDYYCLYIFSATLSIVNGAILIAIGITMKTLSHDISWSLCHIWTGIPVLVGGFMAAITIVLKSKRFAFFCCAVMFVCVVVCGSGACLNGIDYWNRYWGVTKLALDNDKCTDVSGFCSCRTLSGVERIWLPVQTTSCDKLSRIVHLMISTLFFDVVGLAVSLLGVFVSSVSVCCGPWVYLGDYEEGRDPDRSPAVLHVGTVNGGFKEA